MIGMKKLRAHYIHFGVAEGHIHDPGVVDLAVLLYQLNKYHELTAFLRKVFLQIIEEFFVFHLDLLSLT